MTVKNIRMHLILYHLDIMPSEYPLNWAKPFEIPTHIGAGAANIDSASLLGYLSNIAMPKRIPTLGNGAVVPLDLSLHHVYLYKKTRKQMLNKVLYEYTNLIEYL